jgi:hypothetical protein
MGLVPLTSVVASYKAGYTACKYANLVVRYLTVANLTGGVPPNHYSQPIVGKNFAQLYARFCLPANSDANLVISNNTPTDNRLCRPVNPDATTSRIVLLIASNSS